LVCVGSLATMRVAISGGKACRMRRRSDQYITVTTMESEYDPARTSCSGGMRP